MLLNSPIACSSCCAALLLLIAISSEHRFVSAFHSSLPPNAPVLPHATTRLPVVAISSAGCVSRRGACLQQRAVCASGVEEEVSSLVGENVLGAMQTLRKEANEYADMFELTPSAPNAAFYALFTAIKQHVQLGLKGEPFVLRHEQLCKALGQETAWPGFFSMDDLEKAVNDDFLDASRGSTDNRKGWTITDVSVPTGESFEEARMSIQDVQAALEKGTVIMNAAGAHIPKLAGPSLAITDATSLPCAINLYVTAAGKRTSAPPHTDKQDVLVVQTTGSKRWRVYSPPNPADKPTADMFARGKHEDSMPLHALESGLGCKLLLETTINPGDILFIPAAFPHTTSTVLPEDNNPEANAETQDTSVHLTFNVDSHIWDLDYLSARRLALRRACVVDKALGQSKDNDNRYVGKANELPKAIRDDLFAEFPLGLLDEDGSKSGPLLELVTTELERISQSVDPETANAVDATIWKETAERVRQQGVELLDIHRDMYLAAINEGQMREQEEAMTAHLNQERRQAMTPERMQRLSIFRVKMHYDKVNDSKKSLNDWSLSGTPVGGASAGGASSAATLPSNWAFTLPLKVGDEVEADLGGAFFQAVVSRASDGTYDVQFFDGDKELGLDRSQIKLLSPPASEDDEEANLADMTPKQRKRWKKQQEKLKKKNKK